MAILRSYHRGQPEYVIIKENVAAHFFTHHHARPEPQPEEFWSLIDLGHSVPGQACLGLCWGDRGLLFSEYYLRGRRVCACPDRSALVEIGQVASFLPGAGSRLIELTIIALAHRNLHHVIMTATARLRSIVRALKIPFEDFGAAEQRCCRDAHIEWGTYYQNDPRVILIDLRPLAYLLRDEAARRRNATGDPADAIPTQPLKTGACNAVAS